MSAKLAEALAKAQAEMTAAPLNKVNPHFRNKYADLPAIIDAVRPALTKHGLSVTQTTRFADGGLILVTTLHHQSGESLSGEYPLPVGKPQEMGSAITYARRYSLAALCCIAADEDDDAEAAEKGNQTASKPKAAPAPKPAPAAEPLPVGSPQMNPVPLTADGKDTDWMTWGRTFAATIRACPDAETVTAWMDANKAPLDDMERNAPKLRANLDKVISGCLTHAPSKEAA